MADNLLSTPWRKTKYLDQSNKLIADKKKANRQKLIDNIIKYKPLHDLMPIKHTFPRVNILLFGPVQSGKSSVFNTISSVFQGKIFNIARCGRSIGSTTTKLNKFQVMYGGIAEQLRLSVWDTRGIDEKHLMSSQNMKMLLEGKLPDRYALDPSSEINLDSPGVIKTTTLSDVVHCVCIVVDASTIDDMDDNICQNIRQIQTVMNSSDIPHVILLTHIDKICELSKSDTTYAYRSKVIQETVERVAKMFGVLRNAVFVMKCYEDECFLDDNVDTMALLALSGILEYCDAYLYRFYETVINLSSKEASSLDEENKLLKLEKEELTSIVKNYRQQINVSNVALMKKEADRNNETKMLEYKRLEAKSEDLQKELANLKAQRESLKKTNNTY